MIVVDSSALVAVLFREPEEQIFLDAIRSSVKSLVSSVTVVEARVVVQSRLGQRGTVLFEGLFRLPVFEVVPPDATEIDAAFDAFVAYGKRSGHAAQLNFGDLFSYALAKVRGLPLLFKGNDFSQTDLTPAVSLH